MKRGLISWDRGQLPPAAFEARLSALHRYLTDCDLPAAVVYSDVLRSNDVRYFSNYMPYWNRALIVVPRGEQPILLCALSPRVYPWIKSVTIHETILPSPDLTAALTKLCSERGWTKVGMLDHAGLPSELYTQLAAQELVIVDIPRSALRSAADRWELTLHREAARLARSVLEEELQTATGLTDHEFCARLERRLRRAGAEDLTVWVSDARTAPQPPTGKRLGVLSSATLALEYNGHWVKLSRNAAGITCPLPPAAEAAVHVETLSGPYPWTGTDDPGQAPVGIVSMQVEIRRDGQRIFYGDTCLQAAGELGIL